MHWKQGKGEKKVKYGNKEESCELEEQSGRGGGRSGRGQRLYKSWKKTQKLSVAAEGDTMMAKLGGGIKCSFGRAQTPRTMMKALLYYFLAVGAI